MTRLMRIVSSSTNVVFVWRSNCWHQRRSITLQTDHFLADQQQPAQVSTKSAAPIIYDPKYNCMRLILLVHTCSSLLSLHHSQSARSSQYGATQQTHYVGRVGLQLIDLVSSFENPLVLFFEHVALTKCCGLQPLQDRICTPHTVKLKHEYK